MPSSFDVASAAGSYPVRIGPGLLVEVMEAPGDRLFVIDAFLADRFRAAGIDALTIDAREGAKSLDRMAEIVVALRERGATRSTELVAVGGGVVQDIVAFTASIYMRGIAWTFVPTTLLAMADSCIGGKSSINVGAYKNIVGTFHPPSAVLVDPTLTATLSPGQRAAGLCEAAKIALCRGPESFAHYLALQPGVDADERTLTAVCDHALRAKKWFVEIDEFDRGERLLLNFGHTFGHAIEAASRFAVGHGIAVGLGMIAALRLGEAMGRSYAAAPHVARFEAHIATLVAVAPGVAEALERLDPVALMTAFAADKKHGRDRFAVITVTADGTVQRAFLPRDAASERLIAAAFATIARPAAVAA